MNFCLLAESGGIGAFWGIVIISFVLAICCSGGLNPFTIILTIAFAIVIGLLYALACIIGILWPIILIGVVLVVIFYFCREKLSKNKFWIKIRTKRS